MSSLQKTNPENPDPVLKTNARVETLFNIDKVKFLDEKSETYNIIKKERIKEYNCRMRSELARIQTFVNYPAFAACTPEELAAAGFYYFDVDIYVQCFCCGMIMGNQSLKKSAFTLHKDQEPNCRFTQGMDVGNIPKYSIRVRKPVEVTQETAGKYQNRDSRLESFQNWPFYTKMKPSRLAAAGFFYTGLKDNVQCFSCGGSLGNWEDDDDPWKEHCKWFPQCEYLHSVKTEEEIKQYARNYVGFTGVTAKHFDWKDCDTSPLSQINTESAGSDDMLSACIFSEAAARLESFKTWPSDAKANPEALANAGFFYTGIQDCVQCFTCGGQVYKWEAEDDPWADHAKHFPQCHFVLQKSAKEQTEVTGAEISKGQISQPSVKEMSGAIHQNIFKKEAIELELQLKMFYSSPAFSKMLPFGEAVHLSVDLCHTFADLYIVLKNTNDQPVSRVFLPQMLRDLHHITVIEGEAGSGKSSLLRRIAILWASGRCAVLSSFKLVFYIPLSSIEKNSDIIGMTGCQAGVRVTGDHLRDMANLYGNQLLFLLDDYGDGTVVPYFVEEIIRRNPVNRVAILIGVRTNKIGMVRQISKVFTIKEFPLYSSFYLLKTLFSHDIMRKESFLYDLVKFPAQLTILKTPLFTFSVCVIWVHYPLKNSFSPYDIFKIFLQHLTHRHSCRDNLHMLSVCGSLALEGVFESQSNFTVKDLRELRIDEDKVLQLGLLTKFTAQRLHPVYRFFHQDFQTFLAGKKLTQLLESDILNERGQGTCYLKKIDTVAKVLSDFHELLLSAMICSSSSALQIITHLFHILQTDTLTGRDTENWDIFHHQEVIQQLFETIKKGYITVDSSKLRIQLAQIFLDFIIQLAIKGQCLEECCPQILLYLHGKQLQFSTSSMEKWHLLDFLKNHPESLLLLHGISFILLGKNAFMKLSSPLLQRYVDKQGPPTLESEYESTVQCYTTGAKKAEMESALHTLNSHYAVLKSYIPKDVTIALHSATGEYHVPLIQLNVYGLNGLDEDDCENLATICTITKHLQLKLIRSPLFLKSIIPILFYYRDLLLSCTIEQTELDTEEQMLLTCCTKLESLHIKADELRQVPGFLLSRIEAFTNLQELSIIFSPTSCSCQIKVYNFEIFCQLRKLILHRVQFEEQDEEFALTVKRIPHLTVFHLICWKFPPIAELVHSLSFCQNLQEIRLEWLTMTDHAMTTFAAILPKMKNLKFLRLRVQPFWNRVIMENFVRSLGALEFLEELELPPGSGVTCVVDTLLQQLQHLKCLQILALNENMNDNSLLHIAKAAKEGKLSRIRSLHLICNTEVTDTGWHDFFLNLDNMYQLKEINISLLYKHPMKPHPATIKALAQCILRLPKLLIVFMFGWMLDVADQKMLNYVKASHPQSKCINIFWQQPLPCLPQIEKENS